MSSKCEPPAKAVDSLGAGDAGASQIKTIFMMTAPMAIWSYFVPFVCSLIFVRDRVMVPVNDYQK